jgi:hypothetical protein
MRACVCTVAYRITTLIKAGTHEGEVYLQEQVVPPSNAKRGDKPKRGTTEEPGARVHSSWIPAVADRTQCDGLGSCATKMQACLTH